MEEFRFLNYIPMFLRRWNKIWTEKSIFGKSSPIIYFFVTSAKKIKNRPEDWEWKKIVFTQLFGPFFTENNNTIKKNSELIRNYKVPLSRAARDVCAHWTIISVCNPPWKQTRRFPSFYRLQPSLLPSPRRSAVRNIIIHMTRYIIF